MLRFLGSGLGFPPGIFSDKFSRKKTGPSKKLTIVSFFDGVIVKRVGMPGIEPGPPSTRAELGTGLCYHLYPVLIFGCRARRNRTAATSTPRMRTTIIPWPENLVRGQGSYFIFAIALMHLVQALTLSPERSEG